MTDDVAEELNTMCNLSEGIYEDGVRQGVKQGEEQKEKSMVLSMLRENVSLEIIAKVSGWTMEAIRGLADRNEIELA